MELEDCVETGRKYHLAFRRYEQGRPPGYPSIHWCMFPNAHDTSSDVKYSDFVRSYVSEDVVASAPTDSELAQGRRLGCGL